jgi:hypothetical protein
MARLPGPPKKNDAFVTEITFTATPAVAALARVERNIIQSLNRHYKQMTR